MSHTHCHCHKPQYTNNCQNKKSRCDCKDLAVLFEDNFDKNYPQSPFDEVGSTITSPWKPLREEPDGFTQLPCAVAFDSGARPTGSLFGYAGPSIDLCKGPITVEACIKSSSVVSAYDLAPGNYNLSKVHPCGADVDPRFTGMNGIVVSLVDVDDGVPYLLKACVFMTRRSVWTFYNAGYLGDPSSVTNPRPSWSSGRLVKVCNTSCSFGATIKVDTQAGVLEWYVGSDLVRTECNLGCIPSKEKYDVVDNTDLSNQRRLNAKFATVSMGSPSLAFIGSALFCVADNAGLVGPGVSFDGRDLAFPTTFCTETEAAVPTGQSVLERIRVTQCRNNCYYSSCCCCH